MRLNNRQIELAIALKEIVKTPKGAAWGEFTDFRRAVARILEGAETLERPKEMQKRFSAAWKACASLVSSERQRIAKDALGEDYERVMNHPNSLKIVGRVVRRVKDERGELSPDIVVGEINLEDIMAEELE